MTGGLLNRFVLKLSYSGKDEKGLKMHVILDLYDSQEISLKN
jgi:hypothetical protein